jgi:hypothetical protein
VNLALFAFGTLAVAFAVHLTLWRIRLPRRHTATLLVVFFGTLAAALTLAAAAPALAGYGPSGPWQHLLLATFHGSLSLAYIAFYSAIEEDSPSCQIVLSIADAGAAGRSRAELAALLDNDRLVLSKIRSMLRDGMVTEKGAALELTTFGRGIAGAYLLVERVFGLPRGG